MADQEGERPKSDRMKRFELLYNPMSLIGLAFCGFGLGMIIIFTAIDYMTGGGTPYMGVITLMVLPPFFAFGLILVPIGVVRYQRRLHKSGTKPKPHLTLDLNLPRHRGYVILFVFLTFVTICVIGTLSYEGYHYTESVEFCGSCHSVMDPQSITHQNSPHARVSCATCHVGAGAGWYVKSKLSGLYQVYSVMAKKYPKPIPTPIHNLRPARDICEECHWPDFFIDNKMMTENYFLPDDDNTPGAITLMMIIGGQPEFGVPSGIHWHIANEVSYIATDEEKDEIPWVQVKRGAETKVYQSSDSPLTEEQINTLPRHVMDCMDCHNRPAHIFGSPGELMNQLLFTKKVDPDLPRIRQVGAEALAGEYESTLDAEEGIGRAITEAYEDDEDVLAEYKQEIHNAIEIIREVYKENFFPFMKTRWDSHSINIGHKNSPGCFRCHDDNHETEAGDTIKRDCNQCHIIVAQGEQGGDIMYNPRGLEFEHPEDIDEEWKEENCNECHTGE